MPILMYCHGGSFCIGSTFSRMYHNFLNRLACEAQAIVVSVEYRKATEHPLPAAYDDCWDALLWICSHDPDNCWDQPCALTKDAWLDPSALDFSRVYVAGDSTGANIAHQVALRAGVEGLGKALDGLILIHPVFWGKDRIGNEVSNCKRVRGGAGLGDKVWGVARWGSPYARVDDPWFNPAKDPKMSLLGCRRVLICIAKLDVFRDRGLLYGYALKNKGWVGDIVVVETDAEDHAFHLRRPSSPNTNVLLTKIVDFVNSNPHAKL